MSSRNSAKPARPYRYSVNLPDLIADTTHMSAEIFGAYMRLLHSYWRSGPPEDDDKVLARITGMTPSEWRSVRPAIEPYFDVAGGRWVHVRTDSDLTDAYDAINKAKSRTQAATEARKAKARQRSVDRDDPRDEQRDVARHDDLTISKHPKAQEPLSREKARTVADFGEDVRLAESSLVAGGRA